jgi:proteic killer suppression protein
VIREFRHKGLKRFFETGSKAGIQPKHANKLRVQLGLLDVAAQPSDMDVPGWEWHALKGDLAGQWSVGKWQLATNICL